MVGPLVNGALALAGAIAQMFWGQDPFLNTFLSEMVSINALLFFLNLLPIYPLDGGRVLKGLLWTNLADENRAAMWTMRLSMSLAPLLALVGLANIVRGGHNFFAINALVIGTLAFF